MHFPFKKHVPSQVLIDLSVENLETAPSTFLSKVSSTIYLLHFINYGSSIFILYLRWRAFNFIFILSALFFFLSSFFFFFCRYSCFLDTNFHRIAGKGEGINIFLVFLLHRLTNIYLVHRDLYHFFLIDLFVITSMTAATCSLWRFEF